MNALQSLHLELRHRRAKLLARKTEMHNGFELRWNSARSRYYVSKDGRQLGTALSLGEARELADGAFVVL